MVMTISLGATTQSLLGFVAGVAVLGLAVERPADRPIRRQR